MHRLQGALSVYDWLDENDLANDLRVMVSEKTLKLADKVAADKQAEKEAKAAAKLAKAKNKKEK